MGERGSRKIPVTDREFLWVQDDDKGEVVLHVGPTMVSPTAADRIVLGDGRGGYREDAQPRPQRMIELGDAQYAVLHNPLVDPSGGPNGVFHQGRNNSRPLRNGTRHMIPGPCSFYVWPGQRVEVRDAHELASNQYLVVKVYGAVDKDAPYYEITARSAAITSATAEDVGEEGGRSGVALDALDPVDLTRGQLIVIRGLDTQFYIPPTGVDIVPDLSMGREGATLDAATARRLLALRAPTGGALGASGAPNEPPRFELNELADDEVALADELERYAEAPAEEYQKKEARQRARKADRFAGHEQAAVQMREQMQNQVRRPMPPPQAAAPEPEPLEAKLDSADVDSLLASAVHREALARETRKARLVRQAVVLSEKEFCVVIDADGRRQIKVGPARVFPGPYDSFMTRGSDDRIYYAYELLPQRALWLRFISPIAREKLAHRLPRGVELDKEMYYPGDELIITGLNTFFFPFIEAEILHPLNGQPHFGNDHSDVFIDVIGIDQKSGIYVRDLLTGEVRLIRGKQSYLVDPRKEVHITRVVTAVDWNLWIAPGEPGKRSHGDVTSPWAIAIHIPHNTAVLAASATGQRVVEGPCVELLEYDEHLVALELSTGTPKSNAQTLATCFLRTRGNVVSDVIRVETSDFVEIDIRCTYHVTFDPELRDRWFNHLDYVGLLSDHTRSLVRRRCRQVRLTELWPRIPDEVRDLILGERTEGGRRGRLFDENGMWVTEVEVLESRILDEEIGGFLENVQRASVSLQIRDRQAGDELHSEKLRHEFELERLTMRREQRQRQSELDELIRTLEHAAQMAAIGDREEAARTELERQAERDRLGLQTRLEREELISLARVARDTRESRAKVDAEQLAHTEEHRHREALAAIESALIAARSQATVAERQAVQPGLIEALNGLGDKVLLTDVARNMNLVSLVKGRDVATLFAEILGGTKLGRTIETMLPASGNATATVTSPGDGEAQG